MSLNIFEHKLPNLDKLKNYGFKQNSDIFTYSTTILSGQFEMRIDVYAKNGEVKTYVTDLSTNEPYTLHLVAEASGAFVGAIRAEYERVLTEIAEKCFDNNVFKSDGARAVIEYVRQKYGDELEYLWKTFPSNAVLRRKDNNKWYCVLLVVSKRKLGLDCDEAVEIIDLRIDPNVLPAIADGKKYFSGYHMNKKTWFTMCLDGSVCAEEIYGWIDKSYELAKGNKKQ